MDYISHTPQISVIPDMIISKYGEEYCEGSELETTQYYDRVRNDKYFESKVEVIKKEDLFTYIDSALSNKYERFIFFVNNNNIVDYTEVVNETLNKYYDLDITVIKINALSYPLTHLAIDCEKILRNTDSIDNVISYVNTFRDSFKIYFYSPKENVLPSVRRIDFDEDVISASISGKLFSYDGNHITEVKKNLQDSYLGKMFDMFTEDTYDSKVVPFILYSNRYSLYNDIFERKIFSIYPRLKNVKKFPIPAIFGNTLGPNAVGIGFIKKIDE